jgi:hypothetical protein
MRSSAAIITFLLFFCVAQNAGAQSFADHARVSVNIGAQPNSSTFTTTQTVPVYQQTATVASSYGVPNGIFFDGDVTLRVSGGFGVDVGASAFNRSQTASTSGQIPHPLIGGRLRPLSGTSPQMERNEIAGHVDAAYVMSSGRVDVVVAGGAAFFTVSQDLAESVTFAESPTFDTVSFTGVVVSKAMATALGFDAGVDVGFKLSKNVGVGGVVRYSRASMTFPLVNSASGAHADAGGTHAGAGVRFYF